jgi:hypothetical protein
MKIDLPGLLREKLPSGNVRYRVRVERRKTQRVRLYVEPGQPDFMEHYHAARRGIRMKRPKTKTLTKPRQMRGSLNWLMKEYLGWLEKQVAAGQYSQATLKQRRSQFRHLKPVGEYSLDIPQPELLKLRDSMASTSAPCLRQFQPPSNVRRKVKIVASPVRSVMKLRQIINELNGNKRLYVSTAAKR